MMQDYEDYAEVNKQLDKMYVASPQLIEPRPRRANDKLVLT